MNQGMNQEWAEDFSAFKSWAFSQVTMDIISVVRDSDHINVNWQFDPLFLKYLIDCWLLIKDNYEYKNWFREEVKRQQLQKKLLTVYKDLLSKNPNYDKQLYKDDARFHKEMENAARAEANSKQF